MKRSDINYLVSEATRAFTKAGWTLPPNPRWDVTDSGLGNWRASGLVLVNLAEEPEYCEKLMYAKRGMVTPAHTHHIKKEDIICRTGQLSVTVWNGPPPGSGEASLKVNGEARVVPSGTTVILDSGHRVTLVPGVYHSFESVGEEVVIGEVSTANDDVNDNVFADPNIGRFPEIEEDEPPIVRLVGELNA